MKNPSGCYQEWGFACIWLGSVRDQVAGRAFVTLRLVGLRLDRNRRDQILVLDHILPANTQINTQMHVHKHKVKDKRVSDMQGKRSLRIV
eukprot:3051334-Rhodomonas_salina.1